MCRIISSLALVSSCTSDRVEGTKNHTKKQEYPLPEYKIQSEKRLVSELVTAFEPIASVSSDDICIAGSEALDAGWLRTQLPNSTINVNNSRRLGAGVVLRF